MFQAEAEETLMEELIAKLKVIRVIATPPHHEHAFRAIVDIATNTLAKAERLANASLIAAAPEMLEALEEIMPTWGEETWQWAEQNPRAVACEITYADVLRIRAAIAKATGATP